MAAGSDVTDASTAQLRTATEAAVDSAASTYSAADADAVEKSAVPVAASAPLAPSNDIPGVVSSVLAWVGMSPDVSNEPLAPVDSPALWAALAWVRRQNQQTLIDETPTLIKTTTQSSQTADGAVTDNAGLSALVTDDVALADGVVTDNAGLSALVTDDVALADGAVTDNAGLSTLVTDDVALADGAVTDNAGLSALVTDDVALAAVAAPPAFVQVNAATPQTNQSSVAVAYTSAQVAGDTNILAIGWNNATSNITSVTDSAGNAYQVAVPTARGSGLSQAIYYATNIKAAGAGANTVTVTFNTATPFIDIRALEYSGLDPVNPFDVGASASGNSTAANSGSVTTSAASELIFAAGMTAGVFSAAGTNFTNRIITAQDGDIAEDRLVTTAGSYTATASLSSATWLMQVATFKAAGAGGADTIAPTVTINQAAGQADPTSASPINFAVTFSETVTGFAASDISFAGSTVGGTLSAAVAGAGPTYNVAVSGMTGTGAVVVSVPAGAATDAAGNASLASTSTDNSVAFSTVDTTAPTRDDQPGGGPSGSDEHGPDQLRGDLQRDGDGLCRERHQLCGQHGGRHAHGGSGRGRPDVQRGGVGDDGDRRRGGERPGRGGDGCGGQRQPCVDEHGQ